jgi:DNA-binding transcriptional regulator LsrR (DeoR family)
MHPLEEALTGQIQRISLAGISTPTSAPSPLQGKVGKKETHIQREKGIHRIMAYMYASGATIKRIAEECDYTRERVGQILATNEMRALIADIIHNEFSDDIGKILSAASLEAVQVVRELINSETASDSIKLAASKDMLDRYRGRPTQHILHSKSSVPVDPGEEIAQLENELREV